MKKFYVLIPAVCAILVLTFAVIHIDNHARHPEVIDSLPYGPHGEDPSKWAKFLEITRDCGDMGVEHAYHDIFGVWVDAYSTYTDSLVIVDHEPSHEIPY